MGCCSAVNCSNRAEKGHTMYRFPSDPKRRKMWLYNMRRGNWNPSNSSRLCEMHFENSQFENHRADGKIKLKPNALPTLFDVPNPPPMINPAPRRSVYKVVKNDRNDDRHKERVFVTENTTMNATNSEDKVKEEMIKLRQSNLVLSQNLAAEREKVKQLVEENEKLERSLKIMNETLKTFLNEDQITLLNNGRVSQYSNQTIIKGLKFRLALSVHGLEYLRSTGYPLPAYCTIMRRIQDLKLDFGIFEEVLELLAFKTKSMDPLDKYCILSFDEFLIASHLDHDKNLGKFVGHVTIGMDHDSSEIGEKIFVVIARGVKSKWKQVIACHVTPKKSIDHQIMKNFILSCISAVEACGLVVLALSSDLDSRNRSFYSSLGITATREGIRRNSFQHNAHEIFIIPDPCHILKNLKSAMLRQTIYLPESFVEAENLPTNKVNGTFITHLWNLEISKGFEQRFLHHLRAEDIEPNNFQKMNVGAAVRFFSLKTASALTAAVELNFIPKEALTTARFIQVVYEWFTIISSQERKKSITSRNCDVKYIFLHSVIDLFQNSVFHDGWKPLNFAVVIATISFCDIAEFLLSNGFDFVLGHRFTQDATENVISQIRKRAGQMPTAMKAISAVKIISVSQFVSDVKSTNYMNDTDEFLLDFCKEKKNITNQSLAAIRPTAPSVVHTTNVEFELLTYSIEHFALNFSLHDVNCLFYIAGSTTNAVIKHICENCSDFLLSRNLPDAEFLNFARKLTSLSNQGGLKEPSFETLLLVFHCEHFFKTYKSHILRNGYLNLVDEIVQNVSILFPTCNNACNVKQKVVKHFFTVRSFCVKNFLENSKKSKIVYGSASAKKRKN